MNQTSIEVPASNTLRWLLLWRRFLLGAVLVTSLVTLPSARAEDPNDEYSNIYGSVQQADSLSASGQTAAALAKYRDAQRDLRAFQKNHAVWNSKVVAYRLNYVGERIAALSRPDATAPATSNSTNTSTSVSAPPSASSSKAKLTSPGAEPRVALRLKSKPGDKQTCVLDMKNSMEMQGSEVKLPTMTISTEASVKSVSPTGEIAYDLVINDATIVDDPAVMPNIAEMMKAMLPKIKGSTGAGTISDRGYSRGTDFKSSPAAKDPQTHQALDQVAEALVRMAVVPFPEEAVGAGAKWEVKNKVKSQGLNIDQTATYELVSLEGDHATIKATLAQSAANQKIDMPGLGKVDMKKMSGTGTAEFAVDLPRIFTSQSKGDAQSDISMAIGTGAQQQPMAMKVNASFQLDTK